MTDKTPWTPGPWRIGSWGDTVFGTGPHDEWLPICRVKRDNAPIEESQDAVVARLIAAAPEMAETNDLLIGLCQWLLHRFGPDSPEGREATFRLQRANDVRAKARGEQ